MSDDRYEVVAWRGFKFDRYTIAAIEAAEEILSRELHVMQGSYNKGGVGASAGTHDGGGAVDFAATDSARTVLALRQVGFAAWHRSASEGPWSEHIHAVLIGNAKLAPVAARQVTAYKDGRNGLATNKRDNTYRPSPIPTFQYPEEDMALSQDDIDRIAKATAKLVWEQTIQPEGEDKPRLVRNAISKTYTATKPK